MAPFCIFLVVVTAFPFFVSQSSAQIAPPLASGLSNNFYGRSCPSVESIVRSQLKTILKNDVGIAAGLLRIHFHDCFVQGCEGSVLLDGTAGEDGEKEAPPNLTLRPAAFAAIETIRTALEKACGRVVSCSDIAALAARESVYLSGGPDYAVPLGRRDGFTFANRSVTIDSLPPPTSDVDGLMNVLSKLGLDEADLVALSGGHTIGIAHCASFETRLYPTLDPIMEEWFASNLLLTCPAEGTDNTTVNDIRSPNLFDNKYYVDLVFRQGLFTSDQTLFSDDRTKPIVERFAWDNAFFFERFAYSMIKMGMIGVLTGNEGEIRANCSVRNPVNVDLSSMASGNGGLVDH